MTQAFPLQWPHGRPRTNKRDKSSFKVTPKKAYDELVAELRKFNVAGSVVSSDAPLSQRGQPYADALSDPLPDPGVAVYFTRKKRLVDAFPDPAKWMLPKQEAAAKPLDLFHPQNIDQGAG